MRNERDHLVPLTAPRMRKWHGTEQQHNTDQQRLRQSKAFSDHRVSTSTHTKSKKFMVKLCTPDKAAGLLELQRTVRSKRTNRQTLHAGHPEGHCTALETSLAEGVAHALHKRA